MDRRRIDRTSAVRICFPFVGDRVGGSHISAVKLARHLDRRCFEPCFVLQDANGPVARLLDREDIGYGVLPLPEPLAPGRSPVASAAVHLARTIPKIRAFLKREGFDLVHTNDGPTHVAWGLAARLSGTRLLWHHRGDPDARGANLLAPLIADRIVSVSRFARPNRPVMAIDKRFSVVHSPFERPAVLPDRASAKAALRAELGLAPNTRVLGFFGNLVDRKRPLLFVEIVDHMRRAHPDIPVVGCLFGVSLPGRPDLAAAARKRASELGIGASLHLMGFRTPVEPYLAATDILLVPAVDEPFGRGLIEAMMLGTPVVAVDHGGNPEAIENEATGFLVAPDDADAFVPPIARLLGDAALFEAIGRRAREAAFRRYGVDRHVEEISGLYRQLLQPRSEPREVHLPDEGFFQK